MSRITMLQPEDLLQTRLGPYVERSLRERAPDPGFFAVMGHNEELAQKLYAFWMKIFTTGLLSNELKEVMRVRLSRAAECNY
jgi:hypothetical protein